MLFTGSANTESFQLNEHLKKTFLLECSVRILVGPVYHPNQVLSLARLIWQQVLIFAY
jgi:hypothetical protein